MEGIKLGGRSTSKKSVPASGICKSQKACILLESREISQIYASLIKGLDFGGKGPLLHFKFRGPKTFPRSAFNRVKFPDRTTKDAPKLPASVGCSTFAGSAH